MVDTMKIIRKYAVESKEKSEVKGRGTGKYSSFI